ncbi:MAG: DUF4034 domain-containing protein [Rhodanobacteraceae bacterium]
MTTRERWLLVAGAILLLAVGAWTWAQHDTPVASAETAQAGPRTSPFSPDEVRTFLAAAQKAEPITDPLQRCLAYPDPPGSHWSHQTVEAYCRYLLTTGLYFNDLKALIEAGRANEADHRMAALLQRQLANRNDRGLLDGTYEMDFDRVSPQIRPIVDAWKRESPQSAYAYAASGIAYVAAAWDARGGDIIAATPGENLDSMERLLTEGMSDLEQAVKLEPRLVPAYAAMIRVAGLGGGRNSRNFALTVAGHALTTDPSNYLIYARLSWLAEPKWGGSAKAMRWVGSAAQQHVGDNPLLVLIQDHAPIFEAGLDNCDCTHAAQFASYRHIFGEIGTESRMGRAGMYAEDNNYYDVAVIYLSEALRFNPGNGNYLEPRANALVNLHQYAWAVTDGDHAVKANAEDKYAWTARGYAYRSAQDYAHAEHDYLAALTLVPGDAWTLDELGRIYVYSTHEWDKGWNVANQLIQSHPENADGWIFRASIQKDQPRPGLDDTINYFLVHFGDDPSQQVVVAQMRQHLAQESQKTR